MERFIILCTFFFSIFPALAANENIKILVIHSWHQTMPWTVSFEKGISASAREMGIPIEFYTETIDAGRFGSEAEIKNLSVYIKEKYQKTPFDAVLADDDLAADFVDVYMNVPPSIPVVYYTSYPRPARENSFCLNDSFNEAARDTLVMANYMMKKISHLVIVKGAGIHTDVVKALAESFVGRPRTVPVTVLEDFTFDELMETVSQLSSDAVVFYTPAVADKAGQTVIPRDFLERLTASSPAPVFSF